jgi:hypothetical protein
MSGNLALAALTSCGSGNAANLGAAAAGGITGTGAATNAPPHGCGEVDLGFNNFTVGTAGGDLTGPAAATIDPTTNTVTPNGTTIAPIDSIFTATWNTTTHTGAHTLDSSVNYTATPNTTGGTEPPVGLWAVNGLTALSVGGAATTNTGGGIPTTATIVITETVCLGATVVGGCVATGATENEAVITITETYTGNGTTSSFATTFSASCTTVAASFGCTANSAAGTIAFNNILSLYVEDAVVINHPADTGAGTYALGFTSFTNGFDQDVPEPSTFITLGSALAGLGLLRLRTRRKKPAGAVD